MQKHYMKSEITDMKAEIVDASTVSLSPIVTALTIDNGFVNSAGEVYDKNGTFIDFPRELGSKKRKNIDTESVQKRVKNKEVVCLIHERKNYSYFHWVLETLPKFVFLNNHRDKFDLGKAYYHCGLWGTSYQRQALRQLGFNRWNLIDARRVQLLNAKKVTVLKLEEERREPTKELCQMLKDAFVKAPAANPSRRIYLTRKNVKSGRQITNELELEAILRSFDFEIIDPGQFSFPSQVKLFNESNLIVSPHGAALANIVFCNAGTKIIELFNHKNIQLGSQSYPNISQVCDFELTRLPAKSTSTDTDEYVERCDFIIDLDAFRLALANALS
ncbi:MAG: DUF563 domain-containing protein [Cyanophyceae cyanobacterium]